jgi:hypothetical protein
MGTFFKARFLLKFKLQLLSSWHKITKYLEFFNVNYLVYLAYLLPFGV